MRVLMVSKSLVVASYREKVARLAREPGITVEVLVPPSWHDGARRVSFEPGADGDYLIRVAGIGFRDRYHFHFYPALGRLLSELRPDVVHVDEEPYNLATFHAAALARRAGAKVVFFTWQNLLRRYPPPFRWLEQYVLGRSSHAIAGNAEAAQVLRAKGYVGPISVIPQFGVDPEQFSPGQAVSRPFTVGFLGRLVEEKGLFVLLEAVGGLCGDWRLVLAGAGPLEVELCERARELGIADRVQVLRAVPSAAVPELLRSFDVLALPSLTRRNWKEQFGRALVEAMACGVPVVGSSSGEIPNVIGDAGIVVPEGNGSALRRVLAELAASSDRRAALGARGRERAVERFTHAAVASATAKVYRKVLAS